MIATDRTFSQSDRRFSKSDMNIKYIMKINSCGVWEFYLSSIVQQNIGELFSFTLFFPVVSEDISLKRKKDKYESRIF